MSAPTVDPHKRVDVAAPDSYRLDEPVWVWRPDPDPSRPGRSRTGRWREGTVRDSGWLAVQVDFCPAGGGTATDAVRAEYVMRREPAESSASSDADQAG